MTHISRRTAGLAGLIMAPLWIAVVALMTWVERDFLRSLGWSLTSNNEVPYPSATALGDTIGFLAVPNFLVAALLVVVFTAGFRREFRHRVWGGFATGALALYAVGLATNVFTVDAPGDPATWHGRLHELGFVMVMVAALVAFPSSALALRGNPDWQGWRLLGWAPVLLLVIMFGSGFLPGDIGFVLFIVVLLGWVSVMGAHLLSIARTTDTAPAEQRRPDAAAPGLL